MDIPFIIGQIVGIIAMAVFFVSYQCKDAKKLMTLQCLAVVAMCLHYLLINAFAGLTLNIVCLVRNICYANRDKKFLSGKWLPIFFAVAVGVAGILSWESYYSAFLVVGLIFNTICLALPDTQKVRYSMLVSCPLVFTYDVFVLSIGCMANEALSFFSSVIGIIRMRKTKEK